MANGKITYTPLATRAISLQGAHWLTIDNADFNVGTQDFAVDALLCVDPANTDAENWIASKTPYPLDGAAGWHWYYKKTSRRLGLRLNDGGVTATQVETADNQIPAAGTWFWARFQADRDGQVRFYVNGLDVGGGSIAAAAGSLNNSNLFALEPRGALDFVRFDTGRLLSAAWHLEEWDRIRYGFPRALQDFPARWDFEDSLVDASVNLYTLSWGGGGSPAYETGWPSAAAPLTYLFEENFDFGHEVGHLDLRDRQRTLNASAFSYDSGASKKSCRLPFKSIPPTQAMVFDAIYDGAVPFYLYLDADKTPLGQGQFILMAPPLFASVFTDRVDADLDMEEA